MVFRHDAFPEPMAFFGRYIEVTPHSRLVWTNEEGEGGEQVTTVTFEETGGKTLHGAEIGCDVRLIQNDAHGETFGAALMQGAATFKISICTW